MQREDTISAEHAGLMMQAIFVESPVAHEAYSDFDQKTRSFSSPEAFLKHVKGSRAVGRHHFDLAVYYPETGGYVHTKRIAVEPAKCAGSMWREKVEGWGLVGVQFTFLPGGMVKCRVATNSKKRADAWSQTFAHLRDPSLWNWKLVEKHTRRLIRKLRSE